MSPGGGDMRTLGRDHEMVIRDDYASEAGAFRGDDSTGLGEDRLDACGLVALLYVAIVWYLRG